MDHDQDSIGRGRIAGIPSAGMVLVGLVMLAVVYLAFGNVSLNSLFGDAFSNTSSTVGLTEITVTGQESTYYVAAPANVRNRATAMGTVIVNQMRPGDTVAGTIEVGENGSALWLRLANGSGYISATNLTSSAVVTESN